MSDLKMVAATAAMKLVEPGMRLGLGTGSTADCFLRILGEAVRGGLDVVGVPTSEATRLRALALGITLTTLEETPHLDLAIDGADEIDPHLRLIKGGGGALLREKIVATAADQMVVIGDISKRVDVLGAFPLPVEVVPFGWTATLALMEEMSNTIGQPGALTRRVTVDGKPYVTENGNYIVDCAFGRIDAADDLADVLQMIPGVIETGLFLDLADVALIAGPDGVVTLGPGRKG
jgi:ribose 5-phosphate isomerase A